MSATLITELGEAGWVYGLCLAALVWYGVPYVALLAWDRHRARREARRG
jgi:hypothetical protein